MCMYSSSRAKLNRCRSKSEFQMFSLTSGPHVGAPTWRLHTELYKFAWNVSANNSRTVCRTDLSLQEVVYLLIFYSGAPGGAAASGASWVRNYDNPSMKKILVKASGMARGRVRLRPTAYGVCRPR